jgi:hypothetical protein
MEREVRRYDDMLARGKALWNDDQVRRIAALRRRVRWRQPPRQALARGDVPRRLRFQRADRGAGDRRGGGSRGAAGATGVRRRRGVAERRLGRDGDARRGLAGARTRRGKS